MIPLDKISKALVLCPHPDDFDVAGVTLRQIQRRDIAIHVAVAPTYSGILDSFFKTPVSNEEKIAIREQEQRNSLLFFSLEPTQFEFFPHDCDLDKNGELTDSANNTSLVEACILKQAPDAIFIPHPNDANPAHSAMYKMVRASLTQHALSVSLFKQMDPKTKGMRIDSFTPVSADDVAWKTQLLSHHKTQDHRNIVTRGITLAERVLQSNTATAETHHLPCIMAEAFEIENFSNASDLTG
jgi:LmbE family N-acetylglucosaminyl deacetylase